MFFLVRTSILPVIFCLCLANTAHSDWLAPRGGEGRSGHNPNQGTLTAPIDQFGEIRFGSWSPMEFVTARGEYVVMNDEILEVHAYLGPPAEGEVALESTELWNLLASDVADGASFLFSMGVAEQGGIPRLLVFAVHLPEEGTELRAHNLETGDLIWSETLEDDYGKRLRVGKDEIFMTFDRDGLDGETHHLACWNVDPFHQKWEIGIEGSEVGNPQLTIGDQHIFRLADRGNLVTANAIDGGAEAWSLSNQPDFGRFHDIISKGDRVFAAEGTWVYAIEASTGNLLWKEQNGDGCNSGDTYLATDGTRIVMSAVCGQDMVARDIETGAELWRYSIGDEQGAEFPQEPSDTAAPLAIGGGLVFFFDEPQTIDNRVNILDAETGDLLDSENHRPLIPFQVAITGNRFFVASEGDSAGDVLTVYERSPSDLELSIVDETPVSLCGFTGRPLEYEFSVKNLAPEASNVNSVEFYAPHSDIVITSSHGAESGSNLVRADIGKLDGGEEKSVTVTVTPQTPGDRTFEASTTSVVREINPDDNRWQEPVTVNAAPPAGFDSWIDHIEVVQTIQNEAGDVPLVAYKDTLVRVFVRHNAPDSVDGYEAHLRLYRDGSEDTFRPIRPVDEPRCRTVSLDTFRGLPENSMNFFLEGDDVREGTMSLEVTLDPNGKIPDDNRSNNMMSDTVNFNKVPPICARLYTVRTADSSANRLEPQYPEDVPKNFFERAVSLLPVSWIRPMPTGTTLTEPLGSTSELELNSRDTDENKILFKLWVEDQFSRDPSFCRASNSRVLHVGLVSEQTSGLDIGGKGRRPGD